MEWETIVRDNKGLIDASFSFVKPFFEEDYSGHDYEHIKRVYYLTKKIGIMENCLSINMLLAAIFHEFGDRKIETMKDNRSYKSFLEDIGIEEGSIDEISNITESISFKGTGTHIPESLEGKIVQDADRIDAIGAVGIARAFAFGGHNNQKIYDPSIEVRRIMDEKSYYCGETTTINHFYEKLLKLTAFLNTNSAKALAKKRHEFMTVFLEEFFYEINTF